MNRFLILLLILLFVLVNISAYSSKSNENLVVDDFTATEILQEELSIEIDITEDLYETDSKSTFLLFDETSNLSQQIIHKLKPQLNRWSNKHTIFIESNKDEIKLNIYNYFIENVDSLKKYLILLIIYKFNKSIKKYHLT